MKLKLYLQKLEKRKIITKKPNPIYPFLLAILSLALWLIITQTNCTSCQYETILKNSLLILTIFAFIFAILHLIVVKVLKS
ncbi:MAG: hypothetical protein ABIH37_04525 [archaeon]